MGKFMALTTWLFSLLYTKGSRPTEPNVAQHSFAVCNTNDTGILLQSTVWQSDCYCKSSLDFEVSNSSDDNIKTASLPPSASSLFSDFSFANIDRMVTHRISTQSTHSNRCSTGTKPYVIRWAKGHNFQPACKSQGQHISKEITRD